MATTQKQIAEALDLSRTTVSKILSRDPKYFASAKTRAKVFETAEKLGYDFTEIRRPFRREHPRADVGAPCEVTITLPSGEIFDHGRARIINISEGGALIADIITERSVLPLESFRMLLKLSGVEGLSDVVGDCEIVRMRHIGQSPEVGLRFVGLAEGDRERVREAVSLRVETSSEGPRSGGRRGRRNRETPADA